jgi:hypothetical protein
LDADRAAPVYERPDFKESYAIGFPPRKPGLSPNSSVGKASDDRVPRGARQFIEQPPGPHPPAPHGPADGVSQKPPANWPPAPFDWAANVEWTRCTWASPHSGQAGSAARLDMTNSSKRRSHVSHWYSKIGILIVILSGRFGPEDGALLEAARILEEFG